MAEETTGLKRRGNRNLGGRPPVEELAEINVDMENVAQLVFRGHTAPEIAEELQWLTEKVVRYQRLPLVQNRIKLLLGDPLIETNCYRRRAQSAVYNSIIRKANADQLSEGSLLQLQKHLDPYERMELMTVDEKRLMDSKHQLGQGTIIVGSNEQSGDIKQSIFSKRGKDE